jgi:hypothetical protein
MEGEDDQYLLHMRRAGDSIHQVQWRTNLTFLFGARAGYRSTTTKPAMLGMYCKGETEGDLLGDDELRLTVGNVSKLHFARFWPEVDAGETPSSFDDMPPLDAAVRVGAISFASAVTTAPGLGTTRA